MQVVVKKEDWVQNSEGLYFVEVPFSDGLNEDDIIFSLESNEEDIIQKYVNHFLAGDFFDNVCTLRSNIEVEDDLIIDMENINKLPGEVNYAQDSEGNIFPFYDDSKYLMSMAEQLNITEEQNCQSQNITNVEQNISTEFCEGDDVVVSEYCTIKEIRNKVGSVIEVFENGDVKLEIDNKLYIVKSKYLHEA